MDLQLLFPLILCIFSLSCYGSNTSINQFYFDEVRSLSELPLDKLIKIKSTFAKRSTHGNDVGIEGRTLSALSLPMTMPPRRISSNKSIRRTEESDEKGKDSKISKIFQLTVTALSFLAFGGYLLTLIITAMRRTQNTTTPASFIVLSDVQNFNQRLKRPKRGFLVHDSEENDYDTESLYRCMIMMSSEYRNQYYR